MIGQALTYSTDIEPVPAIGREGVAKRRIQARAAGRLDLAEAVS